jgi:tetrahydrodipicolinate N-succinyltransferase
LYDWSQVSIFSHFFWGDKNASKYSAPVLVGKDAYIGPHCVILPNVHIGEGSVSKAGTVVSRNIPEHTYWGTDSAGPLGQVIVLSQVSTPLLNSAMVCAQSVKIRIMRKFHGLNNLVFELSFSLNLIISA